jgi:hypothetical protein
MTTQTITRNLVTITCYSADCNVVFGLDEVVYARRKEDHESFWCTNGHGQHFTGRSEADKLRERLRITERSETFYRDQAALERRRAAAQKGQRTRVLNLIAKGVCPVAGCRRNFGNVRDHMATEHPEFHTHEEQA